MDQVKVGTFTVTAAEASGGKNLELGFTAEYIRLFNLSATDTEVIVLERWGTMAAAAVLETYMHDNDGGDDIVSHVYNSSTGLTDYGSGSIAASGSPDTVVDSGFAGITIPAGQLVENDVWHYMAMGAQFTA